MYSDNEIEDTIMASAHVTMNLRKYTDVRAEIDSDVVPLYLVDSLDDNLRVVHVYPNAAVYTAVMENDVVVAHRVNDTEYPAVDFTVEQAYAAHFDCEPQPTKAYVVELESVELIDSVQDAFENTVD